MLASLAPAFAEAKLAFVVGIDAYPHLSSDAQLQRAVADAEAVGDTLQTLGFTVTRLTQDGALDSVLRSFEQFTRSIQPGDTVLFYYAGHGISLNDGNYLLPSDVPELGPSDERIAKRWSIAERDIKQDLRSAGARVAVVVLDACRNNPFPVKGTRAIGATTRGLARIDSSDGVFSLYSAREGQAALDRLSDSDTDRNSVFARVFLKEVKRPGLSLSELGEVVRDEVATLTRSANAEQVPAVSNDMVGARSIYLAGPPAATDKTSTQAATVAAVSATPPPPQAPAPSASVLMPAAVAAVPAVSATKTETLKGDEPRTVALPTSASGAPPSSLGQAEPTTWYFGGSRLQLLAQGRRRVFIYDEPRATLVPLGVLPNTVFFEGEQTGNTYAGTAHTFHRRCPPTPFPVTGIVASGDREVLLKGFAPVLDQECATIATKEVDFRLTIDQTGDEAPIIADRDRASTFAPVPGSYFAMAGAASRQYADYMARTYADSVLYYGKSVPKAHVLAEKVAFSTRWPSRRYSIDGRAATVICSASRGECEFSGPVSWSVSNGVSSSTGTAQVDMTWREDAGTWKIVAERSRVVSRAK